MSKLGKPRIFGYAIGDLGMNLNFQLIGFYLAYYYTDVFGISPAHVAILILVARIWDAVNDPLMGFMVDKTRTRMGTFRPYVLFGCIPLNLVLVACFYTPDLSTTGKLIYAYVTYISHGMLFTLVGLPYSSISSVITQDQQERSLISSYRMFFAVVIALWVIAVQIKPFVAKFDSEQTGFMVTAAILGGFAVVCSIISFFAAQENLKTEDTESYKITDIFAIVKKNDALIVLSIAMLLNTAVWVTANTVAVYFFKYILVREGLQSDFFTIMIAFNALTAFVAPAITRRIGKHKAFLYGSLLVATLSILRFFVPTDASYSINAYIIISAITTIGMMICSITQWGMLPDTVEYGEYKTGKRSSGIIFSFFSFMQKAAMALAAFVAMTVLSLCGYEANTELTESAKQGVLWLYNVVPGIYSLLCFFVLFLYKLTPQKFESIMKELRLKNAN